MVVAVFYVVFYHVLFSLLGMGTLVWVTSSSSYSSSAATSASSSISSSISCLLGLVSSIIRTLWLLYIHLVHLWFNISRLKRTLVHLFQLHMFHPGHKFSILNHACSWWLLFSSGSFFSLPVLSPFVLELTVLLRTIRPWGHFWL